LPNSPLEMKSIFISETPYIFLFSLSGKGEKCIGKSSVTLHPSPSIFPFRVKVVLNKPRKRF